MGLNMGCGTADALTRRPSFALLAQAMHQISQRMPCVWLLMGAPFERSMNEEFIQFYQSHYEGTVPLINTAGETSLSELTGLLALCAGVISSDSDPYHMAVALRRPTVACFVLDEPAAHHHVPWCRCLTQPSPNELAYHVLDILASSPSSSLSSLPQRLL
jgi:ADP-heptose:LPS heptosyltransferase